MIKLDYQTNNRRWGLSGMKYSSWENYAFGLGYLANRDHYRNAAHGLVEVHVEQNDVQGAWGKEGRIHYYGSEDYLINNLSDWNNCKSAGNGISTCRMNSNEYIYSLVDDYGFIVQSNGGHTTADIFPPQVDAINTVWSTLLSHLQRERVGNIQNIRSAYVDGWNL